MRVLAIDHGSRRIGLAISDELRMIAQPLEFVPAEPVDGVIDRLGEVIREKEVSLIVVGMPRNMNGTYGPAADKVREFVALLNESFEIPVRTWDERLTTVQANRALQEGKVRGKQQRQKVDMMAAAIFLQSFLDATG